MSGMPAAPTRPGRTERRVWRTAVWALVALVAVGGLSLLAPASARAGETFWAYDWGASTYSQIEATPRFAGEHCVIYVDDEALFHDVLATQLATAFDHTVYPALTAAYGSEPSPGIDGDPRIAILVYDFQDDSIDGSFNYPDIDPGGSAPSNRREVLYLNLQALIMEPQNMGALAAHELAHLILYYRDAMLDPSPEAAAEALWLTEGFTTYAERLAGYDNRVNGQLLSFAQAPDTNLTLWSGWRSNYGASYAFVSYLAERQGADFVRALVEQPLDGMAGINATLQAAGVFESFDTLYDDWILANFLDGRSVPCPPYSYGGPVVAAACESLPGTPPTLSNERVSDFGAVYLDFPATSRAATFQVVVDGADKAPLQAALISWDSDGLFQPLVTRFDLSGPEVGDTVFGTRRVRPAHAGGVGQRVDRRRPVLRVRLQRRSRPARRRPVPRHGGSRSLLSVCSPAPCSGRGERQRGAHWLGTVVLQGQGERPAQAVRQDDHGGHRAAHSDGGVRRRPQLQRRQARVRRGRPAA